MIVNTIDPGRLIIDARLDDMSPDVYRLDLAGVNAGQVIGTIRPENVSGWYRAQNARDLIISKGLQPADVPHLLRYADIGWNGHDVVVAVASDNVGLLYSTDGHRILWTTGFETPIFTSYQLLVIF